MKMERWETEERNQVNDTCNRKLEGLTGKWKNERPKKEIKWMTREGMKKDEKWLEKENGYLVRTERHH
jgi:hypothetical protein